MIYIFATATVIFAISTLWYRAKWQNAAWDCASYSRQNVDFQRANCEMDREISRLEGRQIKLWDAAPEAFLTALDKFTGLARKEYVSGPGTFDAVKAGLKKLREGAE